MKHCPSCGETKPLSEFYRHSDGYYDGWASWCKPCVKLNTKLTRAGVSIAIKEPPIRRIKRRSDW